MYTTAAADTSSDNANASSRIVPSIAEGMALCTTFILSFVFIVVGNLLTIVLFAANKGLHKRSWFLAINMAFADLTLGTVSLPSYIYYVGTGFQLWKGVWSTSLSNFFSIVDIFFFLKASFISGERFCAICWPFKHREVSMRAYPIITITPWALALFTATIWSTWYFLISHKGAVFVWVTYVLIPIFIICYKST